MCSCELVLAVTQCIWVVVTADLTEHLQLMLQALFFFVTASFLDVKPLNMLRKSCSTLLAGVLSG